MAFSYPQEATDFYSKYPSALPVFVDEDGTNLYLNHFKKEAITKAKQDQKRLYEVTSAGAGSETRIYPTSFLYSIQQSIAVEDIAQVTVDGETVNVLTNDESGIASALNSALGAAGVVSPLAEVTEVSTDVFDIRVVISSDIEITLTDGATTVFTLTKTFL